MSEKVRQEHSGKQVQPGEKWHKTEFGLLIPNLGVTAHRSAEKTPDFDNNNPLQHSNESASSEKGGRLEAKAKDRERRYDDSEWFTPPKDVEFDTLARNSIEDRFEDAIRLGDSLLYTRLEGESVEDFNEDDFSLLKALCWQLDQHAYALNDTHQMSVLRGAIYRCYERSDRIIKLSEITAKITETDITLHCYANPEYRQMLTPQWRVAPQWRVNPKIEQRMKESIKGHIRDVQALLGDEPPTSSEIVAYADQFEQIHGFVPSRFTLYNWLSQHPDVGEKHAVGQ